MELFDSINISSRKKTPEGYLVAPAIFASVEILEYHWPEPSAVSLDPPAALREPGRAIRIYRPAETLFAEDTVKSFAAKPVTVEHEKGFVNSSNYKSVNVGTSTGKIAREGDSLVGEIVIMDAAAIADLEAGKKFISLGYSPTIEWAAGSHPIFGNYDGVQTSVRGNHITLTSTPRSRGAKVLDTNKKEGIMKRKIYGVEIEIADAVVEVFDAAMVSATDKEKERLAALDAANGKVAALEKQIVDLSKKIGEVTDSAYLDKLAKERAEIVGVAKERAPKLVTDTLSTAEIKRAIVAESLGMALDKASADFVDGAYKAFCATPKKGDHKEITDSLKDGVGKIETLDSIHARFVDSMNGRDAKEKK